MIEIENLQLGAVYELRARNLRYGVWNGTTFVGIREKFGSRFLDECEVPGATAFAQEEVGRIPDECLPARAYLGSQDKFTGRPVAFDKPVAQGGKGWYFTDTGEASEQIFSVAVMNRALFEYLDGIERSRA